MALRAGRRSERQLSSVEGERGRLICVDRFAVAGRLPVARARRRRPPIADPRSAAAAADKCDRIPNASATTGYAHQTEPVAISAMRHRSNSLRACCRRNSSKFPPTSTVRGRSDTHNGAKPPHCLTGLSAFSRTGVRGLGEVRGPHQGTCTIATCRERTTSRPRHITAFAPAM